MLFHNHLNDREFLYGYPVIQYKRIGRNPALVCVDYLRYLELGDDLMHAELLKNILKIFCSLPKA